MNELNSISNSLKDLEKLLYGMNYETHFQFTAVCESTDLSTACMELTKTYKQVKLKQEDFTPISFPEFQEFVTKNFKYPGSSSHGPGFTKSKLETFEQLNTKLWQTIKQKFIPGHSIIYRIPDLQIWIYWDFSFLIVSKDRNKIYLFEGGASD